MSDVSSFALTDDSTYAPVLTQSSDTVTVGNVHQNTQIIGTSTTLNIADQPLLINGTAENTVISTPGNIIFASQPDQYVTLGNVLDEHILIGPTNIQLIIGSLNMTFSEAANLTIDQATYIQYFRSLRSAEILYKSPEVLGTMSLEDQMHYTDVVAPQLLNIYSTGMASIESANNIVVSDLFLRRNVIYPITPIVFAAPYMIILGTYARMAVTAQVAYDMTDDEYSAYMADITRLTNLMTYYESFVSGPSSTPAIDNLITQKNNVWISPHRLAPINTDAEFRAMLTYYNTGDSSGIAALEISPSAVGTQHGADDSLIGIWNTSKLTSISDAFNGNATFNIDISRWNVENVKNMSGVFRNAVAFDQDLGPWKPLRATNMSYMFSGASIYNQSINSWGPLLIVKYLESTFSYMNLYNQPMDLWDTRRCQIMTGTFMHSPLFNQDISSWHVYSAMMMDRMFYGATAFNQPIKRWQVWRTLSFDAMFEEATAFSQEKILQWHPQRDATFHLMFAQSGMLSVAPETPDRDNFLQKYTFT